MKNIPAIYQGQMSSLDDIRVSPLSRAYTFSDSVYEVIPYFAGRPLCFQSHIERLERSLKLSHISVDIDLIVAELHNSAASYWIKMDMYIFKYQEAWTRLEPIFMLRILLLSVLGTPFKLFSQRSQLQPCYVKTIDGLIATSNPLRCWAMSYP